MVFAPQHSKMLQNTPCSSGIESLVTTNMCHRTISANFSSRFLTRPSTGRSLFTATKPWLTSRPSALLYTRVCRILYCMMIITWEPEATCHHKTATQPPGFILTFQRMLLELVSMPQVIRKSMGHLSKLWYMKARAPAEDLGWPGLGPYCSSLWRAFSARELSYLNALEEVRWTLMLTSQTLTGTMTRWLYIELEDFSDRLGNIRTKRIKKISLNSKKSWDEWKQKKLRRLWSKLKALSTKKIILNSAPQTVLFAWRSLMRIKLWIESHCADISSTMSVSKAGLTAKSKKMNKDALNAISHWRRKRWRRPKKRTQQIQAAFRL